MLHLWWFRDLAVNLREELALKHDVFGQNQHTFQSLFDQAQLLSFFVPWATETDSAAQRWITPVEKEQSLLQIVCANHMSTLLPQLTRQVLLSEEPALAKGESAVDYVYRGQQDRL